MARKVDCRPIYGVQFLADDPAIRSECRGKSPLAGVACYKDVRECFKSVAAKQDVQFAAPRQLRIHRLDEQGIDITVGNDQLRPKALILGGRLAADQERTLGLPDAWEAGVLHRCSMVKLKLTPSLEHNNRPLLPMSLDLRGLLLWAWLIPGRKQMQLLVQQPIELLDRAKPADLLAHWADVLHRQGILEHSRIPLDSIQTMDLPLAGALAHEGVANRTLLVGPAGGFYSASGEDIYPNCWSALFAADSLKKALKEPHLQDALQAYRHKWRTTLGEYLRGPQQNLRFLLPLVYRNQVMTNRLAEAILQGKSVVR